VTWVAVYKEWFGSGCKGFDQIKMRDLKLIVADVAGID
jgi:hypothetical protein